jgi:hypothetical protein
LKRSATEVLRRGLDNVVANWPILLLRFAQAMLMAVLGFGFLIAAVIPLAAAVGLDAENWSRFDPTVLWTSLLAHWGVILWLLFLLSIVITLAMAIYAFFQAAAATVYVEGELAAETGTSRRVFTFERWFAGGVARWWRVFLVYNIAWFLGLMALLLPMLVIALLMLLVGGVGALIVGIITVPLFILLFLCGVLLINAWSIRAVLLTVRQNVPPRIALDQARAAIRRDLGRTLAVMVILMAVLLGVSGVVSMSISFPLHNPGALLALMPLQMLASLLQSVVSSFVDSWLLATFAAAQEG